MSSSVRFAPVNSSENDELLCDCGNCKYCDAIQLSDDDYATDDYVCTRCNGAGCTKCEE
jgi:hypothetical protein